jgi:hypothetical protein
VPWLNWGLDVPHEIRDKQYPHQKNKSCDDGQEPGVLVEVLLLNPFLRSFVPGESKEREERAGDDETDACNGRITPASQLLGSCIQRKRKLFDKQRELDYHKAKGHNAYRGPDPGKEGPFVGKMIAEMRIFLFFHFCRLKFVVRPQSPKINSAAGVETIPMTNVPGKDELRHSSSPDDGYLYRK